MLVEKFLMQLFLQGSPPIDLTSERNHKALPLLMAFSLTPKRRLWHHLVEKCAPFLGLREKNKHILISPFGKLDPAR